MRVITDKEDTICIDNVSFERHKIVGQSLTGGIYIVVHVNNLYHLVGLSSGVGYGPGFHDLKKLIYQSGIHVFHAFVDVKEYKKWILDNF